MEVTVETWRFNFFSKLVDRRLWATISRKIFYADDDFFLKLGCKRQVLSELRIQTTLIFHSPLIRFFIFVFHSQSVGEINTELKNNIILLSFKKELFGAKKQLQLFGAKNYCFFFFWLQSKSICCSTNFLGEPQRTK